MNNPNNFIGFSTISSTQVIDPTIQTVNYKAGDSIDLKKGFHAVHGSNFHAFIGNIDCGGSSAYPENMYTNYYDSLISQQFKVQDTLNEETDTTADDSYTLPCPNDTISFGDTADYDGYRYHWDFGNGQIDTVPNPKVFYATPGTYIVTLILTDSTGIPDTMQTTVVAPDCKIYGYLYENPACGGAPIAGDSLCLAYGGSCVSGVSPAYTQIDGSFTFNSAQVNMLDTNKTYTIISKNGISLIQPPGAQKISQWIKQSPVNLYYATTVHQAWERRSNGYADSTDYATALDLQGNIYVTGGLPIQHFSSPWLRMAYT